MKTAVIMATILALVMCFAGPALADVPKAVDKLVEGSVDIVKSPLELIDKTKAEVDKSDNKTLGLLGGLIKSPFHMIHKAGHGVVKIATFPIE